MAKNLPQHLKCASHLKSADEEQVRRDTKELLDNLRAQDVTRLQQTAEHQYATLSYSRQLKVPAPTKHLPEIDEQQMWDGFESDQSSASPLDVSSTDQLNPTEQQEAEFYRALDKVGMSFDPTRWGFEEFDVERDVDETLTNVMQNLSQSRKALFCNMMRLTTKPDLDDSLTEDDFLTDVGLGHPGGSWESDKWFPYPNKTISPLQQING